MFTFIVKLCYYYSERSRESCGAKAITSVSGQYTPRTPLVANSMAHTVQACFSYFQGYAH